MLSKNAGAVGFISLGCPKATVDSERILSELKSRGYAITPSYQDADVVVVNTCGFIDAAVAESLDAIDEAINQNGKVIVTGCLGARAELIHERFPKLLAVTGPQATDEVLASIEHALPRPHDPYTDLLPPGGIKLTPRHYAYLKIAEGCNHRCSFCIIPSLRGDLISRAISEVLAEAQTLFEAGVKELLVVSQDTSAYGLDIKYRPDIWQGRAIKSHITELARALGELAKPFGAWIRLHYLYPYPHLDELITLMANGLILPYIDSPLQHASPSILKAMRRPAHSEKVLERITRWRERCPDLALRSTFITGFPGENEQDFQSLLDFLDQAQLDRVGAFAYSPVEGATANALDNPVPESLKQERLAALMEKQAEISANKLAAKIGSRQQVLIDELGEDEYGQVAAIARSKADAPEIDGVVHVFGELDNVEVGEIIEVEITHSDEHDLQARPA